MDPPVIAATPTAQARHQRLKELFTAALERPPAERETYLREACAADPTLRVELLDLLAFAGGTGALDPWTVPGGVAPGLSAAPTPAAAIAGDVEHLARGDGLGRYLVLDRVGAGGMGVVYAAYDPELDRRVAVKVLRAGPGNVAGETRLLREAQAMARLAHPNVIAVHDVGTVAGRVFIAMEFVAGRSLRQVMNHGRLPWREALALLGDAGRGLAAAHRAGLVHRDFKPDNVLVGDDGRVRVLDFGLARAPEAGPTAGSPSPPEPPAAPGPPPTDATPPSASPGTDPSTPRRALLASPLTLLGTVAGTPGYIAPELFDGVAASARADQFSFCATLWEAIQGQRPYAGANLFEMLEELRRGTIHEPADAPATPRWLRAALLRGLDRDPQRRFASMDELLAALRPPDRRRLWQLAGAAAVALAAAGGWLLVQAGRQTCGGGEALLAGVWDAGTRTTVRASLLATGKPFAAAAAAEVERGLDGYARDWLASRREACETHRRGEASAELLDLRMQCLDRRRDDLRALGGVLAHADGAVAERAAQAVGTLPDLASCADAALLRGRQALPGAPEARAQVIAAERDLARAHALGDAGKWADGLALATACTEVGRSAGYQPLLAESLELTGQLQERLSQTEPAHQSFAAAYVAAEAGGEVAVKVRSAAAQGRVLGYRLARYSEADWWLELAAAGLGSHPPALIAAAVDASRGVVRRAESRYGEALPSLLRAVSLREHALGPDHLEVATSLNSLGNLYNDMGRYGDSEAAYRRALEIDRARLGPDHPAVARVLNNLGSSLRSQGDYAGAGENLRTALAIEERALGSATVEVAQALYNLGNVANDQKDWRLALDYDGRAAALMRQLAGDSSPLLAQIMNATGNALVLADRRKEAVVQYRQALKMLEAIQGPDFAGLVFILDSLGGTLDDLGKSTEAAQCFERSLEINERQQGPDHPFVGDDLAALGIIDVRQGNLRRGRERLERAVTILTHDTRPTALPGKARLALARLVLAEDPARAVSLAREAERVFVAAKSAGDLEEARAWLAQHAKGPS